MPQPRNPGSVALELARASATTKHNEICRRFLVNFRRLKEKQGLGIPAIAKRAGLGEKQVASILKRCEGGETMTLKTLVALAVALDVEPATLLADPHIQ
jgi:Cro/C1-type HTH DNA-binding domain